MIRSERFYYVTDIQSIMGISQTKAYCIIKQLNNELKKNGFITVAGRVPRAFFDEHFFGGGRRPGEEIG